MNTKKGLKIVHPTNIHNIHTKEFIYLHVTVIPKKLLSHKQSLQWYMTKSFVHHPILDAIPATKMD